MYILTRNPGDLELGKPATNIILVTISLSSVEEEVHEGGGDPAPHQLSGGYLQNILTKKLRMICVQNGHHAKWSRLKWATCIMIYYGLYRGRGKNFRIDAQWLVLCGVILHVHRQVHRSFLTDPLKYQIRFQ